MLVPLDRKTGEKRRLNASEQEALKAEHERCENERRRRREKMLEPNTKGLINDPAWREAAARSDRS